MYRLLLVKEELILKKFLTDSTMAKIIIKQVKSVIGSSKDQKLTMKALGLNKINSSVEKEATPQIIGMVRKVNHLIKVEEVK